VLDAVDGATAAAVFGAAEGTGRIGLYGYLTT
jgi:hypothetical protein